MDSYEEGERRRRLVAARVTDRERWRDLGNFSPEWDVRAEIAARWIPPGATVLDLGCGRMALERHLPPGCRYVPCDLFARDERTLVCDFNEQPLPYVAGVQVVTAIGVIEYLNDPLRLFREVRRTGARFVVNYHPLLRRHLLDRPSYGWVNAMTAGEWMTLIEDGGFRIHEMRAVSELQLMAAVDPD